MATIAELERAACEDLFDTISDLLDAHLITSTDKMIWWSAYQTYLYREILRLTGLVIKEHVARI